MARGRYQKKSNPIVPILLVIAILAVVAAILYVTGILGSFLHTHESTDPLDCAIDRYCDECGEIIQSAGPHSPTEGNACTEDITCTVCGKLLSQATGHTPGEITACDEPQLCTVCGEVMAEAAGHEADTSLNCAMPAVCKICGQTMSEAPGHTFTASEDGMTETCSTCGLVINRTESTLEQTIIPETDNSGHYNNTITPYTQNYVLVCGDYAMEHFELDTSGSSSYAALVNDFAAKYPQLNVTSLLIPKACAFLEVDGYDNVLQNQTDFIQATYDMMDDSVITADCMGQLTQHIGEYTYYRTDHHWTSLGAYYASVAYCEANGIEPRALGSYETIINCGVVGSLYNFAGEPQELKTNPDYTACHMPATGYTMTCTTGEMTFDAKAIYAGESGYAETFMYGDQAFTHIVTENKNGRKLILFKESYGNAFAPYMIDYYEEIIVIDVRQDTESVEKIIEDYGITDALIINNVQGALSLQDYIIPKIMS